MGFLKKNLQSDGQAKATSKPALKPMSQKGIMGKGGSLGAGTDLPRPKLKGFGKASE